MNNNEFMNLLVVVNKNNNKKNLLIGLGVVGGLSLAGCCFFYLKNKRTKERCSELDAKHILDKVTMISNDSQIRRLNNTINQLIAEKEIKPSKNPGNDTPSTPDTTS
jgi:hypothetical protein